MSDIVSALGAPKIWAFKLNGICAIWSTWRRRIDDLTKFENQPTRSLDVGSGAAARDISEQR